MREIYDLTLAISEGLTTWPGDAEFTIEMISSTESGDDYNVSTFQSGTHTGTHVDAPRHIDASGVPVDELPLETLIGEAWVCHFPSSVGSVTAKILENARIPDWCSRILLRTANSSFWGDPKGEFEPEYVYMTEDAADWLIERRVKLVGIDYLSIGQSGESGLSVHRKLLQTGILIIEGLDLRRLPGGPCQLCCLPLKLAGGDGSPARVVALR